jgi:hypothetical protein
MMRGADSETASLFSYVSCEARVPSDHPLRVIRAIVDEAWMFSPVGSKRFIPRRVVPLIHFVAQPRLRSCCGHFCCKPFSVCARSVN